LWGLDALELTGRGYVIDWGENRDDVRVWSTWTPTDERVAFERAVIDAWGEAWESIGLPPFLGDCWRGNAPLVYRAVESLVSRSEDARGYCRLGWLASCRGDSRKAWFGEILKTEARLLVQRFGGGLISQPPKEPCEGFAVVGKDKRRSDLDLHHLASIAHHGRSELLIDWEEDRTLRSVLVGMLREADR
jgi:hypothetical protein